LLLLVLLAASSAFGTDPCQSSGGDVNLRVAYARRFTEPKPKGKTLSLRVSVEEQHPDSATLLHRIGCAIQARYPSERRWHALVFSEYAAAKNYSPPTPEQREPPQYIGACVYYPEQSATVVCESRLTNE
jgi:hypothetical protein